MQRDYSAGTWWAALALLLCWIASQLACHDPADGGSAPCEEHGSRCRAGRIVQECVDGAWLDVEDCALRGMGCEVLGGHAQCSSDADADADGDADAGTELEAAITFSVRVEPNPNSVLSAIVEAQTSHDCRCHVEFGPDTGYGSSTGSSPRGRSHRIVVVNMRQQTEYHLRAVARCDTGDTLFDEDRIFITDSLPLGAPVLEVVVRQPELMQPGVTVFGKTRGQKGTANLFPYFIGLDAQGEIVWYYHDPAPPYTTVMSYISMLEDGNLLLPGPTGLRVVTIGGETVRDISWSDVSDRFLHHDAIGLPGGAILALGSEVRTLDLPWLAEPAQVVGDVLLEIDEDDQVVWQWSAFDHLDPTRIPLEDSRQPDEDGEIDWTHGNALVYLEADDSILLSMCTQNWIVKIDRATSEVVWRLGAEGDFSLLDPDPASDRIWFSTQHAPEMHADGRLVLLDNGTDRGEGNPAFSRAVVFRLDEVLMQADITWSHRTDFLVPGLGDADLLDNGNVLINAGNRADDQQPVHVVEVTGAVPAEEVWKLEVEPGYLVYRAQRWTSFWPESR